MHKKMLPQFAIVGLLTLGTSKPSATVSAPDAPAMASRRASRSVGASSSFTSVVGRFSLSGGNPKAPDTARSVRGMALQFQLRSGAAHQMAMLNTPMFGAASPQTFLDLMRALQPDPATGKPDPEKMKAFKASHPDNLAQSEYLAANNPPVSYANSAFWGIHTFKFVGKGDKTTLVRWRFVPQDGEKRLTDEELKTAGANFLEPALISRTQQGPAGRKEIKAGTLTLSAAMPQKGGACEAINYDPLVMTDGIAPTNDPVLMFRSPAYAVSFGKRLSGN